MRYYDYDNNRSEKIPYDKEPIIRQTNYNSKKSKNKTSISSKALALVICVLVILNIVWGVILVNVFSDMKQLRESGTVNNTTVNISSSSALDVSAVASKAKMSVVCVHAGLTIASTSSPDYQGFFNMSSKGAGVIFEDNNSTGTAYIVTCYHVVKGYTNQVYVLLYDSFIPIKGTLIHYSSIYDIAVIKIDNSDEYKKSSSTSAEIADSSIVLEGDGAVAIGNPLGSGFSVTSGSVSKSTDLVSVDGVMRRVIRTDAPINNGNSGGGLFNHNGELIGIVSAKSTDNPSINSYIDCVAYAIPSNLAISLAQNIQRNQMPVKAVLGIGMLVENTGLKMDIVNGRYIPVQTVVVSSVEEGSVADKAGFEINDHITGFIYGDTVVNVTNIYSFDDHAFAINKGDKVTFYITRDGEKKQITLTIEEVVSADYQDWYGN